MKSISSERVLLRRLQATDLQNMLSLISDPDVVRYTPMKVPQTEDQAKTRLESQIANQKNFEPYGIWAAEDKVNQNFIGWFMLMPAGDHVLELGSMILQKYWGQGYAVEISKALIRYAESDKNIHRIIAHTIPGNAASISALKKMNFTDDGLRQVPDRSGQGEVTINHFTYEFAREPSS